MNNTSNIGLVNSHSESNLKRMGEMDHHDNRAKSRTVATTTFVEPLKNLYMVMVRNTVVVIMVITCLTWTSLRWLDDIPA